MHLAVIRRWLFVIASGGCLLGTGCPDADVLKNVLAGSIEGFFTDVIGILLSGAFPAA